MTRDWTQTKAVLAAYDKLNDEFCKDLGLLSNSEALEMLYELRRIERAVKVAFIQATSDVNSPDKVEVVGLEFIRKMVNREEIAV